MTVTRKLHAVGKAQKNVAGAKKAPRDAGDCWTWTAICADTKLIPSWYVGGRDSDAAIIFMDDLAGRQGNRRRRCGLAALFPSSGGCSAGNLGALLLRKRFGAGGAALRASL